MKTMTNSAGVGRQKSKGMVVLGEIVPEGPKLSQSVQLPKGASDPGRSDPGARQSAHQGDCFAPLRTGSRRAGPRGMK